MLEGIKVYCLDISKINKEKYFFLRSMVSEQRRQLADKFRFIEDSYRSVCAAMLVKYSLSMNDNYNGNLDFLYNDYGKPYLKDSNAAYFNLSHSGNRVVVAVAGTEVGIDVEKIQSGIDGVVDTLYTEKELDYVRSARGRDYDERMVHIWTMKESYCKFLGLGLSAGLEKFCVDPLEGTVTDKNGIIHGLRITSLPISDGYCVSVCGSEPVSMVTWLEVDDLLKTI